MHSRILLVLGVVTCCSLQQVFADVSEQPVTDASQQVVSAAKCDSLLKSVPANPINLPSCSDSSLFPWCSGSNSLLSQDCKDFQRAVRFSTMPSAYVCSIPVFIPTKDYTVKTKGLVKVNVGTVTRSNNWTVQAVVYREAESAGDYSGGGAINYTAAIKNTASNTTSNDYMACIQPPKGSKYDAVLCRNGS